MSNYSMILTFLRYVLMGSFLQLVDSKQCKRVSSPSCEVCSINKTFSECSYFSAQLQSQTLKKVSLSASECMSICCSNQQFILPGAFIDLQTCRTKSPKPNLSGIAIGASIGSTLLFCISFAILWSIFRYFRQRRRLQKIEWMTETNPQIKKNDSVCSICLQQKPQLQTQCKHCFHFECIYQWVKYKEHCPVCRSDQIKNCKIYCKNCFECKSDLRIEKANFKKLERMRKSKKRHSCSKCRSSKTENMQTIESQQRMDQPHQQSRKGLKE